eukprot:SM000078S22119  [mRNA]  locus=s78:470484:473030:+ [translate_table: standard]
MKVSIPEDKQSFAWMYSAEDQGIVGSEASDSVARFPGVGAQVLGPNDQYLFQYSNDVKRFWGDKQDFSLSYIFSPSSAPRLNGAPLSPENFKATAKEGFQVSPTLHQGYLRDNGKSPNNRTVESVRWEYVTRPLYGWGDVDGEQLATAGWLAAFRVCMAGGLSSGFIEWGNKRYDFVDAPSYTEKNWGGSFPKKWFWIQCNVFDGADGPIALTAGGGRRDFAVLGSSTTEEVAMMGVHYKRKFYSFTPWQGNVRWSISPWGSWQMWATSPDYEAELQATTDEEGTVLRAPTADAGLAPMCKDTFFGTLHLSIWERSSSGARGRVVLDITSDMAALEVGGGPWWGSWDNSSQTPEPLRSLVGLPINVNGILDKVPSLLRPPGI